MSLEPKTNTYSQKQQKKIVRVGQVSEANLHMYVSGFFKTFK